MRLPKKPLWFKVVFVAFYCINTNEQLLKIVFLHPLLKDSSLVRAQLTPGTGPIIANLPFVTSQMGDFPICVALAHFLKSAANKSKGRFLFQERMKGAVHIVGKHC